ncbi:hypothetical protein [Sanyastnella coralliicola]|uniref:hypothetical protein n=1 Tax=Sanyastnella coralliicola TaxID=3069118 RepID=UPI0027BA39E0|nr:hypothetical protein [Longitalea sp. SCSIO 12813]
MKLALNKDQTIGDFREQFNQLFPRLSIQLFTQPHGVGEGSPAAEKVDESRKLAEWLTDSGHENVEVDGSMSVAELEAELEKHGLHAQVFRKSGNLWLETTRTDSWSLEKVNNETY